MITDTQEYVSQQEWEDLVDILRDELQEYGGFLVLLRDQQKAIIHQEPDTLREIETEIEEQILINQKLRTRRVGMVSEIAERMGEETDTPLKNLLPGFPPVAVPMMEALIDEINSLIDKARNNLRQNHMLLARASQVTETILAAINPKPSTKVYGKNGSVTYKANSQGTWMHTSA